MCALKWAKTYDLYLLRYIQDWRENSQDKQLMLQFYLWHGLRAAQLFAQADSVWAGVDNACEQNRSGSKIGPMCGDSYQLCVM